MLNVSKQDEHLRASVMLQWCFREPNISALFWRRGNAKSVSYVFYFCSFFYLDNLRFKVLNVSFFLPLTHQDGHQNFISYESLHLPDAFRSPAPTELLHRSRTWNLHSLGGLFTWVWEDICEPPLTQHHQPLVQVCAPVASFSVSPQQEETSCHHDGETLTASLYPSSTCCL